MEKINIADILKDCPRGMELDCTMFNNVQFIDVDEDDKPICIRTGDIYRYLTKFGTWTFDENAKCVIFPKGKTTWEGFVPPCKFKDGDVISVIVNKNLWYGIYQKEINAVLYCYVDFSTATENFYPLDKTGMCLIDDISEIRFATEEEKQKLFDVIKANGYRWNAETKTLEKLPKFKDGDILANDDDTVFIYNGMEELSPSPSYYVYVIAEKNDLFFATNTSTKKYGTRFATEKEKNILFEAIKKNGYRWHEETKHLEKLIEPRFTVGDTIKSEKWQATRTIQTYVAGVGYFTTINDWVKIDEQDEWELVKDTTPIFKIGDRIKKKARMIRTVDDLINTLEKCKERYPEFGKYIICVNASLPDDIIPTLKEPMLYINTDIGQVEIYTEDDEE